MTGSNRSRTATCAPIPITECSSLVPVRPRLVPALKLLDHGSNTGRIPMTSIRVLCPVGRVFNSIIRPTSHEYRVKFRDRNESSKVFGKIPFSEIRGRSIHLVFDKIPFSIWTHCYSCWTSDLTGWTIGWAGFLLFGPSSVGWNPTPTLNVWKMWIRTSRTKI